MQSELTNKVVGQVVGFWRVRCLILGGLLSGRILNRLLLGRRNRGTGRLFGHLLFLQLIIILF